MWPFTLIMLISGVSFSAGVLVGRGHENGYWLVLPVIVLAELLKSVKGGR